MRAASAYSVRCGLLVLCLASTVSCQPPAPPTPVEGSSAPEGSSAAVEEGSSAPAVEVVDTSNAVALLDGQVVMTTQELELALTEIVQRYERLPQRRPTDAAWRNARRRRLVEESVGDALLARHVAQQSVTVTEAELEEYLRQEIGHVYTDERLFERFVQSRNETRESYLAQKRQELMIDRVLAGRGEIEPSDVAIEEFYTQNQARWQEEERVLLSTITVRLRQNPPEEQDTQARARIEELRRRVVEGAEDFATVASTASESADRMRGGDMGWVARGSRVQFQQDGIEDPLFRASAGSVTEPMRTQLGYQIFQVRDRRAAGIRGLDEVRDVIVAPLRRRNRERLRSEVVGELRSTASVELLEDRWGLEPETASPEGSVAPPAEGSSPH